MYITDTKEKEGKIEKDGMSSHLFDYNSGSESETDSTSVGGECINIVAGKKRKCDNEKTSVVSSVVVSPIPKRVTRASISSISTNVKSETNQFLDLCSLAEKREGVQKRPTKQL